MTSLGKFARCKKMSCETLDCNKVTVSGPITGSHKVFGSAMNQGELHHNGSIFYIKWTAVHQIDAIQTGMLNSNVNLETTAPHGLSQGDTVHIGQIPFNNGVISDINGIPASEIVGVHVISAAHTSTNFTIVVPSQAIASGTVTNAVPLVKIDRYRYTDMNDSTGTWLNSTTLPTALHTNTNDFELFYA